VQIVIAGAGKIGSYIVERLVAEAHDVTVVDHNEKILEELSWQFDIRTVVGRASSLDILREAGINTADIVVAVTNSDETNLLVCMLADTIKEDVRKIARVRELPLDDNFLSSRISKVFDEFINPDYEAATYLERVFEIPGACDVIDFADGRFNVFGLALNKHSAIIGRTIRDLGQEDEAENALIVSIARSGELIIPRADDVLQVGDTIYIASEPEQNDRILNLEGRARKPIKSVIICGGRGLGPILARKLVAKDIKVKLIEEDPKLCEKLAEELDEVLVLNGEATDQKLLRHEGIEDVDVFVGVTLDDEDNILASLLAKRLGAKKTAVAINKNSYINLVDAIGIDMMVSPMIAGASSILKFVRPGVVSSIFSTRDNAAEVFELITNEKSKVVGKPLKDVDLPAGVIVAAIIAEDKVTVPRGDTVIAPGENVILFANRSAMPKLEKLMQVRVSFF